MNEDQNNIDKENKKKTLILVLIAIVTLSLVAIGAAYAFFAAQADGTTEAKINATSGTTDVLSFEIKDEDGINITASMDNFASGLGNEEDSVTGTAKLMANDATNEAEGKYYVYLNIEKNELEYSTESQKAELILQVKKIDKNKTESQEEIIKAIDGLEYIDQENAKYENTEGFDITNKSGLIKIAESEIKTSGEIKDQGREDLPNMTTHEWEITITLVNLNESQNDNTGKELTGKLILQKDVIPTSLADVCDSNEKAGKCIKELYEKSDYSLSHIVYHNNTALAESKLPNATLNANDDSYRYSGSSEEVKNFVCLDGSETQSGACTSDADLYRIIGFFPNDTGEYEMKLIKATEGTATELGDNTTAEGGAYSSVSSYHWNSTKGANSTNMWQYSNLNKKNLNGYYLNTYLAKVSGLSEHITEHDWTTGGFPSSSTYNAQQVYNKELGNEKLTTSDSKCYAEDNNSTAQTCTEDDLTYKNAKIGLMYVSDYGYAAYPEAWNQYVSSSSGYGQQDIKDNNWMFLENNEWRISRNSDTGVYAWNATKVGYASNARVHIYLGVRPVFYLASSTKITGGEGSQENPFRLGWN